MSGSPLPMILDGLVLILLAATIFFAARLSLYLRDFRASRRDFDKLVSDLSSHVARAEKSVAGMREAAREAGRDLQVLINEAKALTEELQFMGETGNNLASRLEKLAEKSSRAVPFQENPAPARHDFAPKQKGFAIRDPEFDAEEENNAQPFAARADEGGNFQSRAEKELYEALRRGRKEGMDRPS